MTRNEAVLEQIRTLAAELSPEERLSAIRTIAEAAPVASEPVAEKDELVHRLWAEQEAWFAQPLSLREKHRGQFIAVQNGSVIDRDPDKRTLHLRVRREHPGAPIPILDGNWDQVPDLVIRSPRLERIPDWPMPHVSSTSYFPPFPTVPVILHNSDSGAHTPELLAYSDTGADGTLAPSTYLNGWTTLESHRVRMRSHWGEARNVLVYAVDLEVVGHLLPGVEVVADTRGHEVLLGRNLRNLLILLLDGPHGLTDILSRRPARIC